MSERLAFDVTYTGYSDGSKRPECWCGTDEALARGEKAWVRYDIVCPKHDEPPTLDVQNHVGD